MEFLPWFRALHLAATVMIGGACAFQLLILRRVGEHYSAVDSAQVLRGWIRSQLTWGAVIGLMSWVGWLVAVAVSMSGLSVGDAMTTRVLGTVLTQTSFGTVWVIRAALLLAIILLVVADRSRALPMTSSVLMASTALTAGLAWSGHALGAGPLHVWVDAVHMLAATGWLGMLPPLWLLQRRALKDARWQGLAVAGAHRFFLPGGVAVAALVGSGLANTAWMLGSLTDFTETRYGRVLMLKLALFVAMVMLAAINRAVLVPRAHRVADPAQVLRQLRTSVLTELFLGLAVIGVVAWLGVTAPPAHEAMSPGMRGM